jgi:molybdopterin converting factor small subunit
VPARRRDHLIPVPIEVLLPGVLGDLVGGRRIAFDVPHPATVGAMLDAISNKHVALGRRLLDETGAVRRFVNIYVDGEDIRRADGLATPLHDGSTVQILPSVAGGAPAGL